MGLTKESILTQHYKTMNLQKMTFLMSCHADFLLAVQLSPPTVIGEYSLSATSLTIGAVTCFLDFGHSDGCKIKFQSSFFFFLPFPDG